MDVSLTTGGLIVMCLSIGCVIGLLLFCLYKVFTIPPSE